jgi:hypothetical protein
MYLDFKRPNCIIEDECVSWSGKYKGFYGTHYHKGKPCHVVGAIQQGGGIVARHYNDETCINEEAAKYAARKYWNETIKPGLVKRPEAEESDERSLDLNKWFDDYARRRGQIGHA